MRRSGWQKETYLRLPIMVVAIAVSLVVSTCIALGAETDRGASSVDPGAIALYPIVKAPPGASQGYLITSSVRTEVVGGDDLSEELGEIEEFEFAVYARYTVLDPGDFGEGRLLVEAMALDRSTLRPVALPPWQGVLHLAPSESVWEDGEMPSWAYDLGVSLDWLREWMTSPADAPADPIEVGGRWESVTRVSDDPRFEGLELRHGTFTVTGEYQQALRPDAMAPPVASILETYRGRLESAVERVEPLPWCMEEPDETASFDTYLRWIDECLESVVAASLPSAMALEGTHRLLLVHDDFPWGGHSNQVGRMIFTMDEAPEVTLEFTTEVVRHERSFEQGAIESLAPEAHKTATLDASDWIGTMYGVPSGAPADIYAFWGAAGDGALIEMNSSDFVPYLILMDEEWNVIRESYDVYDGESAEVFARLPYSGEYFVQATTVDGQVFGEYTISLDLGPDVEEPSYWDDWWGWEDDDWDFDWEANMTQLHDVHAYDMQSCASVPLPHGSAWVIRDQDAFLDAIRDDATREYCLEQLQVPDFERYVLVGIEWNYVPIVTAW